MQQPADVPPPTLSPAQMEAALRTTGAADPQVVLGGLRAQREELGEQLRSAENLRESIVQDIRQSREQGLDLSGLNTRLAEVDKRIASIDQQIAAAELEVARATAVPGAIPPEPRVVYRNSGDEEGAFFGGFAFALALMVPYLLWRRRRRQKRGPALAAPADTAERLRSIEQSVEAIAVEMERIGEGQRFMSRLFTERGGISALAEGAAQPVPVPARERAPQTPSR